MPRLQAQPPISTPTSTAGACFLTRRIFAFTDRTAPYGSARLRTKTTRFSFLNRKRSLPSDRLFQICVLNREIPNQWRCTRNEIGFRRRGEGVYLRGGRASRAPRQGPRQLLRKAGCGRAPSALFSCAPG